MHVFERSTLPIQHTKLYRPELTADLVPRTELLARLEASRRVPLTLVVAPAGYGKTTLVSHWLESSEAPSAWLSLDETDNHLSTFLDHLLAAVRALFPDACRDSLALLQSPELPPVPVLARYLSNDLDRVATDRVAPDRVAPDQDGEPLILALDDYHCLREPAVHELMDHLLRHPPRGLHLAILTRSDPPLSLAALRSRHQLHEIRMQDLRFTRQETESFLARAAGRPINASILPQLHESTEGWPVALRLTALALRHGGRADDLVLEMAGGSRQVRQYLAEEVLALQAPAMREWLNKTSILERFCAPLCESVCRPDEDSSAPVPGDRSHSAALDGREFMRALESKGLFGIALDERQEWYRYHHLFREILRRHLAVQVGAEELATLHRRASSWLAANGCIEEAIRHALKGGDAPAAARLVAESCDEALNREQWPQLARWLERLPPNLVAEDPRLLLCKAFSLEHRYQFEEAFQAVDQAEALLSAQPLETATGRRLRGEIETLRAQQHYMAAAGERAVGCAERAMALLPPEAQSARGHAILSLAMSLMMVGDSARARDILYRALEDRSRDTFQTRVLVALCWVHWVAGELTDMGQAASRLLQLGDELELPESRDFGCYFLGIFHYQRNELVEAQRFLEPLVTQPYARRMELFTHGAFALALARLARGQDREARDLGEAVLAHLLEIESVYVLPLARAFLAELELRQGGIAKAAHWAADVHEGPLLPMYMFYVPELTQAKAWIARGEPESLQRAAGLLTRLHEYVEATHDRRCLIEVLALEALLHDAEGNEPAALAALARAVSLSHPAGFIRLFADLGPPLAKLLHRLEVEADVLRYVGEILAAIQPAGRPMRPPVESERRSNASLKPPSGSQPLPAPLTPRELEILDLLARRLSNREIADQLFITPGTVKVHSHRIYEKLGVSSRRQAAAKALGLGLVDA